jgi:hypothetical protein
LVPFTKYPDSAMAIPSISKLVIQNQIKQIKEIDEKEILRRQA